MLLKVSYFLLGYMLVDGFFLMTCGANVTLKINSQLSDISCPMTVEEGVLDNNNLTILEGDRMKLIFVNKNFMNYILCNVSSEGSQSEKTIVDLSDPKSYSRDRDQKEVIIEKISNSEHAGRWTCLILTLRDITPVPNNILYVDNHHYNVDTCYVNIFVEWPKNETIIVTGFTSIPNIWIYIGIGIVVAVIIIAQTAVILYLKSKAKRKTRLDTLSLRIHDKDVTDAKRYSQPPGVRKSKFARMLRKSTNRDDESIYETLEELKSNGEQTPPVPPIETIPTLKKKQKSQSQESSDTTSKSLPRPDKGRLMLPRSSTLNRIPERESSPELDISTRPPLPLPTEVPEERSATPSRVLRTPFPPIEEGGHSAANTLTRPRGGICQASVKSELDNILKMRNASMGTSSAKEPPAQPKKHSFPSLRRTPNKEVASDSRNMTQEKFVPEIPNPLPIGKSAVILGLAPGPASRPKSAIKSPPKPFGTATSPLKPAVTPKTVLKSPVVSNIPPVAASTSTNPPIGSKMFPRPPVASKAPNRPFVTPAKPSPSVPKPPITPAKPLGAVFKPHTPQVLPIKPMTSKFGKPIPQHPTHSIGIPPTLPPAPIEEALYEESEPFYNEEEPAPSPHPPRFERPTPQLPTASRGIPPPLPQPNIQEEIYEEYTEEPLYNSDEEWTYEPLQQYNIYSS